MENFDRDPRSFNERAFLEIQKLASLMGFEVNMIENRADEIRFQVLRADQQGFGEAEHEKFLEALFETSTFLTPHNTELKIQPSHAINIIITPQ